MEAEITPFSPELCLVKVFYHSNKHESRIEPYLMTVCGHMEMISLNFLPSKRSTYSSTALANWKKIKHLKEYLKYIQWVISKSQL